jgi:Cu+-exporting ATPase
MEARRGEIRRNQMEIRRKRLATAAPAPGRTPRQRLRATLPVAGLVCGGGALTVEAALSQAPGVIRAYVNPATEMAYVEYDPDVVGLEGLKRAIESVGYQTVTPGGEPE